MEEWAKIEAVSRFGQRLAGGRVARRTRDAGLSQEATEESEKLVRRNRVAANVPDDACQANECRVAPMQKMHALCFAGTKRTSLSAQLPRRREASSAVHLQGLHGVHLRCRVASPGVIEMDNSGRSEVGQSAEGIKEKADAPGRKSYTEASTR